MHNSIIVQNLFAITKNTYPQKTNFNYINVIENALFFFKKQSWFNLLLNNSAIADTAIQRPSSSFSLFQYLILMVILAERSNFQSFVCPN